MPPPAPPIDIVTVAIAIATALFGADLARVVGPYAVIVLGAVLGGAWSTSRRAPGGRLSAAGYLLGIVGLALLITVPLAELAARYVGVDSRWMLGPVAAVIGGIGPDWPAVARWALGVVRGVIERRAGGSP